MQKENLKNIDWLLVGYIILHYYIDNVYFFLLSCVLLIWYIFHDYKLLLPRGVKGKMFLMVILFLGLLAGGIRINQFGLYKIIRDLFYVLNPIIFTLIATNYKSSKNHSLIKTIAFAAVVYACLHLISFGINFAVAGGSIAEIREIAGKGEFIEVLGMILFFPKNDSLILKEFSKKFSLISFVICTMGIAVSFSRTYIIMLFIIMFCVLVVGQHNLFKVLENILRLVVGAIVIFGILYAVAPSMTDEVIGKFERASTEISTNLDWTEQDNITSNWRGYEVYCARQQFGEASLWEQLFGQGFGRVINTHGYEKFVTDERGGITILHNGFYNILIKTGLIGLLSYVFFFIFNLAYYYRKRKQNYSCRLIIGIYLAILFSTPFIVGLFRGESFLEACLLIVPLTRDRNNCYSRT